LRFNIVISKQAANIINVSNLEIFKADFNLMLANCRLYNRVDTFYYKYANRLEQAFQKYLDENARDC